MDRLENQRLNEYHVKERDDQGKPCGHNYMWTWFSPWVSSPSGFHLLLVDLNRRLVFFRHLVTYKNT